MGPCHLSPLQTHTLYPNLSSLENDHAPSLTEMRGENKSDDWGLEIKGFSIKNLVSPTHQYTCVYTHIHAHAHALYMYMNVHSRDMELFEYLGAKFLKSRFSSYLLLTVYLLEPQVLAFEKGQILASRVSLWASSPHSRHTVGTQLNSGCVILVHGPSCIRRINFTARSSRCGNRTTDHCYRDIDFRLHEAKAIRESDTW